MKGGLRGNDNEQFTLESPDTKVAHFGSSSKRQSSNNLMLPNSIENSNKKRPLSSGAPEEE